MFFKIIKNFLLKNKVSKLLSNTPANHSSSIIKSVGVIFDGNLNLEIGDVIKELVKYGIDNNQREVFFGPSGTTRESELNLKKSLKNFVHYEVDIRDRYQIIGLVKLLQPDVVVHAAAQPSHDRAAYIPFDDFDTNAVGTLNMLEACRQAAPDSPFIYLSTNKVYGDLPNTIPMVELETRWEFADDKFSNGISETFSIDQSTHSIFGASKVAGDIMVQEYGKYFGMPTCTLRGGCLTGPNHAGVELHGFLSYLIKCNIDRREYQIFGYKGKQVRDNIHSFDVANFIYHFYQSPRSGEVYNLGGGKDNSCSILEAFKITEQHTGISQIFKYADKNRIGDHICYYSDLNKIGQHFPKWGITKSLEQTISEIAESWIAKAEQ
jgi:CDP-paratose 2-epimerase